MTRGLRLSRVLIAEDEMLLALALRALLEAHGIAVVGTATDGQAAVELCRQTRPDAVLMDLRMPGMDGLEATRRIMAECPTRVVVLTALDVAGIEARAREVGAALLMAKPAELEAVLCALQDVPLPRPPTE